MFRRSSPTPATDPQVPVDISGPHDTCLKCGRPVPLGVSLCDLDNPGHIKSPSSTQVHGTIVVGVLVGFILLGLLFRFGSAGVGPFPATLVGAATRTDGGLDVVVRVTNDGTRSAGASCRISARGAPDFRDYVFFSAPIEPGATAEFAQVMPPAPDARPLQPANLVVACN